MNPQRFDRFLQSQFLQQVGRERVTALLLPFAGELMGHGILLPAPALPDDLFFQVLATLPRQQAHLSPALLEVMTAIEVINDLLPDERTPLVVSEIRLRLSDQARPVLLQPAGPCGRPAASGRALSDAGMTGFVDLWIDGVATPSGGAVDRRRSASVPTLDGEGGTLHDSRSTTITDGGHRSHATTEGTKRARYKFSRKGSVYVVRYDGMPKFHMPTTDGTNYLDQLLHRENESFRATELERLVKPDKAGARSVNSIQRALDVQALRELRSELLELERELAEAESAGRAEEAARLEAQVAKMKQCLLANAQLDGDSGERARNNVRKAIGRSIARLRKGGPAEQAFARHLTESLSLGYEVMYVQPLGKVWE
jgi:hypothetical protein